MAMFVIDWIIKRSAKRAHLKSLYSSLSSRSSDLLTRGGAGALTPRRRNTFDSDDDASETSSVSGSERSFSSIPRARGNEVSCWKIRIWSWFFFSSDHFTRKLVCRGFQGAKRFSIVALNGTPAHLTVAWSAWQTNVMEQHIACCHRVFIISVFCTFHSCIRYFQIIFLVLCISSRVANDNSLAHRVERIFIDPLQLLEEGIGLASSGDLYILSRLYVYY